MRILVCLYFLLFVTFTNAQTIVPFTVQKQETIKGGLKMIGNNILNRNPANMPYSGTEYNDNLSMKYIDIDDDTSTFSSSAATLTFTNVTCSKIRYAGLYWGAFYDSNETSRQNIKLKIPSQSSYIDITADKYVYDCFNSSVHISHKSYVCYKDVTDIVSGGNPNGEYIVANIKAEETSGITMQNSSAGWMLVIIYEDPLETAKHITIFDGYTSVATPSQGQTNSVEFTFSGFKTLPSPLPVKTKFGVAALEGDLVIWGDRLAIEKPDGSFADLSNAVNPSDNFFNGSISYENSLVTQRRPASENTLGWDIDLFSIENTGNSIIQNGQTSAKFKAYSVQDRYDIFFSAFEVEVIEPKINLLKTVEDASGTILNGKKVPLGSTLYYALEFQNVGNDDAVDYTITDILPNKVSLDTSIPIEIPSGSGITYATTALPNGSTQLTFQIPNNLVTESSAASKIRFAVKLSGNCNDFQLPCSEIIPNKAYSVYKGKLNNSIINDAGSFSSLDSCNIGTVEDTVFYADLSSCVLDVQITDLLCGENMILTASAGFDGYEWTDNSGNVIANTKSIIVSNSGVYRVAKTVNGCVTRNEVYTISTVQRQSDNPLIPYAGVIFTCSQTQKSFPQVFLCGAGKTQLVDLSLLTNVASVLWQKYSSATSLPITETCPPNDTHVWNVVSSNKAYTLSDEGIYRVLLTFNNGCVATFYFRVHTSPITPVVTKEDIYCGVGKISVSGASSDYEFAVSKNGTVNLEFQNSPNFTISEAGNYTVYIRKKNRLEADCMVTASVSVVAYELKINGTHTNETCENLNDGVITFSLSDGKAPCTAMLKNLSTNVTQQLTNLVDNTNYTFSNLAPAQYELLITDSGVCSKTQTFTIEKVPSLRFSTSTLYSCQNNKTYTELVLSFDNSTLEINKLQYVVNGTGTPKHFDRIEGNTAYVSQNNLISGDNQTVTILYSNVCSRTENFSIQIAKPLDFNVLTTNIISSISIEAVGGHGGYRYYFDDMQYAEPVYYLRSFDNGYTDSDGNEIKQIKVRVEDRYGCSVERVVEEIFYDIEIPTHFTPNGDGINDTWYVKNAKGYPRMEVVIFDRVGRKITQLTPYTQWDGKLKNMHLPSGDYWYIIRMNNARERRTFRGHFTLYR